MRLAEATDGSEHGIWCARRVPRSIVREQREPVRVARTATRLVVDVKNRDQVSRHGLQLPAITDRTASVRVVRTCDSYRIKGWFFLANAPDDRVPGILTWSQDDGATLELIGGLSPGPQYEQTGEHSWTTHEMLRDVPPSTLYGVSDSGKKLSLWGAERGSYKKTGFEGTIQEEFWHAGWVCVGAHVSGADEPVLRGLRVALDDLYYLTNDGRFCAPIWAKIEGIEHPGERQENGTFLLPYTLSVVGGHRSGYAHGSIESTTYRIDTDATRPWVSPATEANPSLKLDFMLNRRRRGMSIELAVSATARIAAADGIPRSAESLLQRMSPLLGLMSLATFDAAGVESIGAETIGGEDVSLLCRTGNLSRPDAPLEAAGLVFTLDDVPLDSFLETWQRLTSSDQAQYAWNALVGLIGHSPLMVEEHVSQVVAAAEGFHTWCLASGGMSLKDRLKGLHNRLPEGIKGRLRLDVERWADWAVWARNHVDHGGAEKYRDIGDFYQFKVIADAVRLVIYVAVLKELGVPDSKIEDAVVAHPRLRILAQRCAEIASLPAVPTADRPSRLQE